MNYAATRFSSSNIQKPTLYTETEAVEPTQEDIEEYARRIGIDPETEPHLLHLARSGLMVKLPPDWKPCKDSHRDVWFYYNNTTHVSQWDHPMDSIFKDKVIEARKDHAMNRMQSLDFNSSKPLKSLPPLKKGGGGLNPLTFPSSPLTRLGPLRNPSFSSSDDISQFSGSGSFQNPNHPRPKQLLQSLDPLRKPQQQSLGNNSSQHQLNELGGPNKLNGSTASLDRDREANTRQRVKLDSNPPAPVKKAGLTLSGAGANFLKSAKITTVPANSDVISSRQEDSTKPGVLASSGNGTSMDAKDTGFKSLYERDKVESLRAAKLAPEADAKYFQAQSPDRNNLVNNKMSPSEQSSTSTVDPDSDIGKPLKSILAKPSLKNRVRLDENENTATTKNLWDISPKNMTDDEYNLWSALDYGNKREPSVKFNLDDPKLTFEFSNPEESDNQNESENTGTEEEDSENEDEEEDVENSADYDVTNNGERSQSEEVSRPFPQKPSNSGDGNFPVRNQMVGHPNSAKVTENNFQAKAHVQNSANGTPLSSLNSTYGSNEPVVDRATIKATMEKQIKEFEAKVEDEGKQQQKQIRNKMDQTISMLKSEMESLIERTKGDFELHKKMEVEKARVEMETNLMHDLEKIRTEYNEKLSKKKQELAAENEATIKTLNVQNQEQLKQLKNDARFTEAKKDYEKQLEEEIQQLKTTMNEQHKKQIDEMRSLHQSTIQQLKSAFKAEEEKLKKDHSEFIVDMLAKFDTEKQNLLRSFESEQDKIKQEFAAKASQLTDELKQNLESMRSDFEEKTKEQLQLLHAREQSQSPDDSKASASIKDSFSKTVALKQAERELVNLKIKYTELEGKYASLKKGVQNVVSVEQAKMDKNASFIHDIPTKDESKVQDLNSLIRSEPHPDIPVTHDHDQNNTIDSGAAESDDTSFSISSSAAHPADVHDHHHPSIPSHRKSHTKEVRINKMMTDSNSRLNQALSALDDLKKQILDIKAEQRKVSRTTDGSESEQTPLPQQPPQQLQYSDPENPTTDEIQIIHHRKKSTSHNVTLPLAAAELRVGRAQTSRSDISAGTILGSEVNKHHRTNPNFEAPSVSTATTIDVKGNRTDDRNYMIEAKDFIKSQKYRLKRSGLAYGTPVSTSVGAKHRHDHRQIGNSAQTKQSNEPHSHYQILQSHFEREKMKHHIPNSSSKFDLNQSQDHHHSETESSGVSSLKEHGSGNSGDKSKIGQDIEGILSSLQQLDGQMKYLWSVVSGTDTSVHPAAGPTPIISTPGNRPLNPTSITQRTVLGPGGPVTLTSLPGYRDPLSFSDVAMKYNLAPNLITPGNQALINSINVANSLQFRRSTEMASNPIPVLTTLEEHVNNIRNRQNRILKQYPPPVEGTSRRSDSPSISERTKDLREWLEKF